MKELPPLVQFAEYREPDCRTHKGNPFIEALFPRLDFPELSRLLKNDIDYQPEDRLRPTYLRLLDLQEILLWRWPFSFSISLYYSLDNIIRTGYRGRNPVHIDYWNKVRNGREILAGTKIPSSQDSWSTALGLAVVGDSGTGKSCAIRSCLSLYPQLIIHTNYEGQEFNRHQISYLVVECPPKGAMIALCHNFFRQVDKVLGTGDYYFKTYTRNGQARLEEMIGKMYTVSQVHGIGLLIIEEVQNLTAAKANDAEGMLNYFVQLVNDLCLPIVVVGTPKAFQILRSAFRNARRFSGQGDLEITRMMLNDPELDLFLNQMWRYQYVRNITPFNVDLKKAIHYESQGIADLMVKVFILAQIRAMLTEDESMQEVITVHTIASVRDSLALLQPMLDALRADPPNSSALSQYDDLREGIDIKAHIQEALRKLSTLTIETNPSQVSSEAPVHPTDVTSTKTSSSSKRKPKQSTNQQANNTGEKAKPSSSRKIIVYEGGIIDVISQGKANQVTPYESLLRAGYIEGFDYYLQPE